MTDDQDNMELADSPLGGGQVRGYQRRTPSGQVIQVRPYTRTDNSAVTERAKQAPGRPAVAAASGRFPGDRALPVWPDAGRDPKANQELGEKVEYEGLEDTGVVDQAVLDREVPIALEILSNFPSSPALRQLIGVLQGLSTATLSEVEDPAFDPDVVDLARRVVRISGYSYISKKTGKVVRVNPYTQLRWLISALGGPTMAAKKGLTPDLLDRALPGYEIKKNLYKVKETSRKAPSRPSVSRRRGGRRSDRSIFTDINKLPIDRSFDLQAPKAGEDYMRKAMSPSHPLESVRSSREGSTVIRGNESWTRGMDGLWYKAPRRNNRGIDDRTLTRRLSEKGGHIELHQAEPLQHKSYPNSQVDYTYLNESSPNYAVASRYYKALEPTFQHLPDGIADSINGHIDVQRTSSRESRSYTRMARVSSTQANDYYPRLRVMADPEFERDLISSLPKQQREGYSVPSILHPSETLMARASANYVEELFHARAPGDMVERMYDRLNAAYDATVKKDDGDYTGLTGRTGWVARMTGDRSEELATELREGLSLSALRTPEDFLAEAWTEFVGNPSPRPIAEAIGETFQSSMDEFSDYLFRNNWVDASDIPERVYSRTSIDSPSRHISRAIGGSEDYTIETNLTPRDLRSVLMNSSKYVDIRNEDGTPRFDAQILRDGDTATLTGLTYPMTDPEAMPTGIPKNITSVMYEDNARYYTTPMEDLRKGPANQKFFSDFIDQENALRAIEALEETSFSEGVRRFEVNTTAEEDSILYAHAGYYFNPVTTDVHEISTILNDLEDMLTATSPESKDYLDLWEVPPHVRESMTRKLEKWQSELSDHPETWPTPKEIADLGRYSPTERSMGETVLGAYSWDGVKELSGDTYDSWSGNSLDLPNLDDDSTVRNVPSNPSQAVPASVINSVSRAVDNPDSSSTEPVKNMADTIVSRHEEIVPNATTEVVGDMRKHKVVISDEHGELTSIEFERLDDGTIQLGDVKATTPEAAVVATDLMDHLESSYQQTEVTGIRKTTSPDDPVANLVLANSGYDWENAPDRDTLAQDLRTQAGIQLEQAREVLEISSVHRFRNSATEDMFREQSKIDKTLDQLRDSINEQIEEALRQYESDPKGPTPFEIAQIGKREAAEIESIRRASTSAEVGTLPDPTPSTRPRPGRVPAETHPTPELPGDVSNPPIEGYDPSASPPEYDLWVQGGQVETIPRTTFVGLNTLTLGGFEMFKTFQGFWNWARNSRNPTARRVIGRLLKMLIKLLPSSPMRGFMLMSVGSLAKRMNSPRPEDWPSPREVETVFEDIMDQVEDISD